MAMRVGDLSNDNVTEELIALYGKPGVPDDVPFIDSLGRVNGKTYPAQDNIPDFLRSSAVQKKPKEDKLLVKTRPVTLIKDSSLTYPTLCFKVFVQPDPAVADDEARFAKMFARAQCRRAESVHEADLIVFGGGSDVDPVLYGETRHDSTWPSPSRDKTDMDLYLMCKEHGIPMLGICRGAQFLHVMNGGKLYQDVDGHYGDHSMWDILNNKHLEKISSVHHQMVIENVRGGMEIIGTSAKSHERALNNKNYSVGSHADIEAFWYRDTCCIGIQGHPEYEGYHYFTKWTLEILEELVFANPDLEWTDGNLRMKPDLLAERDILKPVELPAGEKEKN
jgi:gamma-glutamyl-gamma-aminobutyrate hydrolase PuuD